MSDISSTLNFWPKISQFMRFSREKLKNLGILLTKFDKIDVWPYSTWWWWLLMLFATAFVNQRLKVFKESILVSELLM